MNKKNLVRVFIFGCAAFVLFLLSKAYLIYQDELNVRGDYAFAQTKKNLPKLSHIRLVTAENGEINLYQKDDMWFFKEAADYYVNTEMLAKLFDIINHSRIVSVLDLTPKKLQKFQLNLPDAEGLSGAGTRLTLYDVNDKMLDDVVIGSIDPNNSKVYWRRINGHYIYKSNNMEGFSGVAQAWIPYPLLSINPETINKMIFHGVESNPLQELEDSPYNMDLRDILTVLTFINYNGIVEKEKFFQNNPNAPHKQLQIITKVGLIYEINIYKAQDNFWLEITLKQERIPDIEVPEFIKNNQKYFANWIFMIDPIQGLILYEIELKK